MRTEIDDLIEHLDRYRAVTLQVLDLVDDDALRWRPGDGHYMLGQQLLHIALTEDMYTHGLFGGDWDLERARFPAEPPTVAGLRTTFARVRPPLVRHIRALEPAVLAQPVDVPDAPSHTLRSWLWFMLEHELHHKGQIWCYLRQMGITAPFYALPLPAGARPDIGARQALGGF